MPFCSPDSTNASRCLAARSCLRRRPSHCARTSTLCNLLFRDQDIPVPRTYPVSDRVSLVEAWRALAPRDSPGAGFARAALRVGATKVRDADQAWHWISYWHTMRGVPVEDFTLSEFLPGRDLQRSGDSGSTAVSS